MKRSMDRKGSNLPVLKTNIDGNPLLKLKKSPKGVIERLEKLLEDQKRKNKNLEENLAKALHELSIKKSLVVEQRQQSQEYRSKIKELEQELNIKEDLLKKKTSDLTKASEKHYELEQELAFFKIDSKFESLGHRPRIETDDTDILGESTYIGKARYRSNQYAQDVPVVSPQGQKIQVQSLTSPQVPVISVITPTKAQVQSADKDNKETELNKKIKALMDDLEWTEKKLQRATAELNRMTQNQNLEKQKLKGEEKFKLRQKLAQKMSNVTKLRDMATQVESEIDRKQAKIEEAKKQLEMMQSKATNVNNMKKNALMLDKEQQINESNEVYNHLKAELQEMMDNIQKETQDIRRMEEQLREEQIEKSEEMTQDLDEAVTGLNIYLENMKTQAETMQQQNNNITREKHVLEEKVQQLEKDLSSLQLENSQLKKKAPETASTGFRPFHRKNQILPDPSQLSISNKPVEKLLTDATDNKNKSHIFEKRIIELEQEVRNSKERNRELSDQMIKCQSRIKQLLENLEDTEARNKNLSKLLSEKENEIQEKTSVNDTAFKPYNRKNLIVPDPNKLNLSNKTLDKPATNDGDKSNVSEKELLELQHQLRSTLQRNQELSEQQAKSQSKIKQLMENLESSDIKNKNLVKTLSEKENKSQRDEILKKKLADDINRLQNALRIAEEKSRQKYEPEIRRLYDELSQLEEALRQAEDKLRQSYSHTPSVHGTGSEISHSEQSSLYSDEQELYDELQRELMELKRYLRDKAQNEASYYKDDSRRHDVVDGGNSIQDSDFLQQSLSYRDFKNTNYQSNPGSEHQGEKLDRGNERRTDRERRKRSSVVSVDSRYRAKSNNIQSTMLAPNDETSHMISTACSPIVSKQHKKSTTPRSARQDHNDMNWKANQNTEMANEGQSNRREVADETPIERRKVLKQGALKQSQADPQTPQHTTKTEHRETKQPYPRQQDFEEQYSRDKDFKENTENDQEQYLREQEEQLMQARQEAKKQYIRDTRGERNKDGKEQQGRLHLPNNAKGYETDVISGEPNNFRQHLSDEYQEFLKPEEISPDWRPTRPNPYSHRSEGFYPVSSKKSRKPSNVYIEDVYRNDILPGERITQPVSAWRIPNKDFPTSQYKRLVSEYPRTKYLEEVSPSVKQKSMNYTSSSPYARYPVSRHSSRHRVEQFSPFKEVFHRSSRHPPNLYHSFDGVSDSSPYPVNVSPRSRIFHRSPSRSRNYVLQRRSRHITDKPTVPSRRLSAGNISMVNKHGRVRKTLSMPSRRMTHQPWESFTSRISSHPTYERIGKTRHVYVDTGAPLQTRSRKKVVRRRSHALFCNVREHFILEDFINELQEKIKYLKRRRSLK